MRKFRNLNSTFGRVGRITPRHFATDYNNNNYSNNNNKMLNYRRETALQGGLVLAKSGRVGLGDNILQTL